MNPYGMAAFEFMIFALIIVALGLIFSSREDRNG